MELIYLVVAMSAVTYIPRMLPLVLLHNVNLPSWIHRFMVFIPYAALGALIFPGVLHSTGANQAAAVAGCTLSVILALWELNIILVVVGGIAGAFVVNVLF